MSSVAYKILVIDDQQNSLDETRHLLIQSGYTVDTALSGDEAIEKVKRAKSEYAVALIDFNMIGKNGGETNRALLDVHPRLNTIFLSADDGQQAVKEAWFSGARTFVEKGDSESLLRQVKEWYFRYIEDNSVYVTSEEMQLNQTKLQGAGLVGCSAAMVRVVEQAAKFAPMKDVVRIEGETGVGKEMVAHLLHPGPKSSFYAVNCATLSGNPDLMQSTLFGHTKGAFTGADREKKGIFEEAGSGTVFLDEIGSLPLAIQDTLLRVIREGKVRYVGSSKEIPISCRIIVASKPDYSFLPVESVRPDFLERVNVLVIKIPPLRERPEDIPLLVEHFCNKWAIRNGEKKYFLLGAIEELKKHDWPRNVAQLEHAVIRLSANTQGERITRKEVKMELLENRQDSSNTRDDFSENRRQLILSTTQRMAPGSMSLRKLARITKIPYATLHRDLKILGIELDTQKERRGK